MDLKQRLVFCKQCEKRQFGDTGLICSLTKRKPDFNNNCPDFVIDPKEAQKIAAKSYTAEAEKSSNNGVWVYIAIALIIIRIIIRLSRD